MAKGTRLNKLRVTEERRNYTMNSTDPNHIVFVLMLCYTIIDGIFFAVRVRKARITHDREAALARLYAHPADVFKRR